MDIGGAYGNDNIVSISRSFDLANDSVILRDDFKLARSMPIVERFVTLSRPEVVDDGSIRIDSSVLSFGDEVAKVDVTETSGYLYDCFLIDLTLKDGASKFEAEIKVN